MLEPVVVRYRDSGLCKYLRADAAFANPEVYQYLEDEGFLYAIRLPSKEVLSRKIDHLLIRPVGRPPKQSMIYYHHFLYQAGRLEHSYPKAAASLREGLEETFTINRLGLSARLRKRLATTNLIESLHVGVEIRTGRVTHWQDGVMALRWAAAAALESERSFRKIVGHEELWMLLAALDEDCLARNEPAAPIDTGRVAA